MILDFCFLSHIYLFVYILLVHSNLCPTSCNQQLGIMSSQFSYKIQLHYQIHVMNVSSTKVKLFFPMCCLSFSIFFHTCALTYIFNIILKIRSIHFFQSTTKNSNLHGSHFSVQNNYRVAWKEDYRVANYVRSNTI